MRHVAEAAGVAISLVHDAENGRPVSLEMLAEKTGNARAKLLADTLDRATGTLLEEGRSPSRKAATARSPGRSA